MNFLVKLLVLACVLSFPVIGKAQEIEIAAGLYCDTQEQVVRFLNVVETDPRLAAQTVNTEAKKDDACVFGRVAMYRGRRVETIRNSQGAWAVTEILIVAVETPYGFLRVEPAAFWSAFKVEEHGA